MNSTLNPYQHLIVFLRRHGCQWVGDEGHGAVPPRLRHVVVGRGQKETERTIVRRVDQRRIACGKVR